MKLVVLNVNFCFVLFACPVFCAVFWWLFFFLFFFSFFWCFNFTVVVIKSYVFLLTLFFPLIIQDWNKNVNVIYFRQHFFSCVIKYIFKVSISLFFLQSFCIPLDPGSWFSLIVRFHFPSFCIDSRYQGSSAFVF